MMRFEFTYKIDDVREAVRTTISPQSRRGRGAWGILGWLLASSVVSLLLYLEIPNHARPAAQDGPEFDLLLILIPALFPGVVGLLLLCWSLYRQTRLRPAVSRDPNVRLSTPAATTQGAKVIGSIIVGLIMLAIFWLTRPGPGILVRADRPQLVWLATTLLLADMMILLAYGRLSTLLSVRSQWNAKPAWRRDKVIIVDEAGVSLIDSHSQSQYCWAYFSKARETANLLILHSEENLMHLLPKRAVPEGQLDQVRALIHNGIPDAQFLVKPGGFAVLPRPVLPVEPISQ